jgi:hypothetical protein
VLRGLGIIEQFGEGDNVRRVETDHADSEFRAERQLDHSEQK